MALLIRFLQSEKSELMENNIRLRMIGQLDRLPPKVRKTLQQTMAATQDNTGMDLILALSYGARTEIVEMAKALAQKTKHGQVEPESITADMVADHLYTREIPDPDLLIRTSGEMRVSNFLLWQIAYSEIFVTPTLWPDFSKEELLQILNDFQRRDRRFGAV